MARNQNMGKKGIAVALNRLAEISSLHEKAGLAFRNSIEDAIRIEDRVHPLLPFGNESLRSDRRRPATRRRG
jgi:hypothetical protein